jgi:hypothetical protein
MSASPTEAGRRPIRSDHEVVIEFGDRQEDDSRADVRAREVEPVSQRAFLVEALELVDGVVRQPSHLAHVWIGGVRVLVDGIGHIAAIEQPPILARSYPRQFIARHGVRPVHRTEGAGHGAVEPCGKNRR